MIFADWTAQTSPETVDADGNTINPNAFNVARSYINVTGSLSHVVAFRVTPDVVRETNPASAANGSLVFRIKYAYAQFNLDDWMTRGTYARLGIQQTPWLDFAETIYRYRFQGTMFAEREGYFASADAGAAFHYELPGNYGDVHGGVFNGENYNRAEANDQKAIMVRATVRPFPNGAARIRGLRASIFYDGDHYIKNAERTRLIAGLTYEHRHVHAGFEFLDAHDQQSATRPALLTNVEGRGFSVWATPRSGSGWEVLLRYDRLTPNRTQFTDRTRSRTIVGVAYWFPHQGAVSSALMFDYDGQGLGNATPPTPGQSRVGVHGLVSF